MTHLNKILRKQIVNKAIEKTGVHEQAKRLIEKSRILAEDIRQAVNVTPDHEIELAIARFKDSVNSLVCPGYLVCSDSAMQVLMPTGEIRRIAFHGVYGAVQKLAEQIWSMGQIREMYPYLNKYCPTNSRRQPMPNQFIEPLLELEDMADCLLLKIQETENAVYGIIFNVGTVKKLIEVWPEAKELLPCEEKKEHGVGLPAIPIHRVNALLGLPSENAING